MKNDNFSSHHVGIHCMGDENSKSVQTLVSSIFNIIQSSSLSLQVPLADL